MKPFSKESFMNIRRKISQKPSAYFQGEAVSESGNGEKLGYWNFIVLGSAAVLVASYYIWVYQPSINPASRGTEKKLIVPNVAKINNVSEKLPEEFKDLPIRAGAKVTEAYTATYPESPVKQATAIFDSGRSPQESYNVYLKWAADNGWEVINKLDSGPVLSLYLRKGDGDMNITINGKSVNISYVNSGQ